MTPEEVLFSLYNRRRELEGEAIRNYQLGVGPAYTAALEYIDDQISKMQKSGVGFPIITNALVRPPNAHKTLKDQRITFDDKMGTILVGEIAVRLPPFQNEHCLCRVLFRRSAQTPIDWSIIYDEMTEDESGGLSKKNQKAVQDAMYALNNRIKKEIRTEDNLFSWKGKSIIRNF